MSPTAADRSAALLHKLDETRRSQPLAEVYVDPGKLHSHDPATLAVYRQYQDDRLGPDPLAEGGHKWPKWTTTEARKVRADRPLRGWRMWSVVDVDGNPRLCAPFITNVHGESPDVEGLTWQPGRNTSSSIGCPKRAQGKHPLVDCRCGLRVVQSLTVLRAFATNQADRIGPMIAWAEVDVWGKIAPFAPDDDWRHTVRAEHAQIVGPLHLDSTHAALADALAEHYGLKVEIERSPTHDHWGTHGAAGLLVVDEGKVLLQLRPEGVHEAGTWSIPGGARGKDETPEDAALREAAEECGIGSADVEITCVYAHPCSCDWEYVTCIAELIDPVTLHGNWESQELRWVALEDVEAMPLHPQFKAAWPDLREIIDAQGTEPNISQITDRVWTGGDRGNTSPLVWMLQLDQAGITHVLDCRPQGGHDQAYAQRMTPDIDYLIAGQNDDGQTMPDSWFSTGVDFAVDALTDPDAVVLAHCHMGINRGPSMALAILLAATGMTPDEAVTAITNARPIAELGYAQDAVDWHRRTRQTT
jgi:8-oxo-dGTP pyrophosphatase MutT (NUDIX family)